MALEKRQRRVEPASVQEQARALGDPTRHRVFRYVADAGRPVGVAELTEHFGLNHNAIRQHLAKLVTAGLLVETVARRSGPGRPPLAYAVNPAAEGRWGTQGPYERVALLLAEALRTGDSPEEVGRRAGRQARTPGRAELRDPVGALVEEMARQGFEPAVRERRGAVEVVLQRCPFESAALVNQEAVCAIHLGLAEGVAETLGGLTVDELVVRDPRRAGCRLTVRPGEPPPS